MGNIFDTILKFSETYQNLEEFQRSDSSEFACGRMAFIRAPGWIVPRGWFSPRDGQHFRGSDRRDLSRFEFERLWSVIFYFLAKFFFKKSRFIDLLGTFLTSHFFQNFLRRSMELLSEQEVERNLGSSKRAHFESLFVLF